MTTNSSSHDSSSHDSAPSDSAPKPAPPISAIVMETGGLPAPLQKVADRAPVLARTIQFAWRLGERWGIDKCPLMAAAMAFFGLLSLFPVLLAALSILGQTLADRPELRTQLLQFAGSVLPPDIAKSLITGEVQKLASSNAVGVSVFSIVSLLWSGRAFFDTLSNVLNSIWWQAKPRTFLQSQLVLAGTFLGAGALWLLSTAISLGLTAFRAWSDTHRVLGGAHPAAWSLLGQALSWLLTLFMFWTIYRFLPNAAHGRRGRIALGSALVASIAWEAAKILFARFLSGSPRYGLVYGSVAGIVLTLMWLYISSSIILFGAEVTAAWEETRAALLGEAKPTQPKPEDEGAALPEVGPAAAPVAEVVVDNKVPDKTETSSTR